jgi:hypothetical protein
MKSFNELKTKFSELENKFEKLNGEKLCYEQTCKELTEQLMNIDKKKFEFLKLEKILVNTLVCYLVSKGSTLKRT